MGLRLVPLTVDHYFYDLEEHPVDSSATMTMKPRALDLELINEHLKALIAGDWFGSLL